MIHARAARATRFATTSAFAIMLVLALLPLAFGLFFAGVDVARVDVPLQCEVRGLLAKGLPLWLSPSLGQGAPLLTSPNAQLFYPTRWLTFVFAPELGVHLHASVHLALMGAGAAWLARTFGLGVLASVTTGLTFALSGTALDLITHSTYLAGGAWLPIVWAGARRLKRARDRVHACTALVVGLTALLLAGEPHAFAIGTALVVVEALSLVVEKRARAVPMIAFAVGSVVVAGAMGSVLWIPALSELALSSRDVAQGLPMSTVLARSFSPAEWPGLIWPAVLTDVGQGMQTLRAILDDDPVRHIWNRTPYVGGLALLCVILGVQARRARIALVVAAVAFVMALGTHGGLLPLLVEMVPPVGLFRFPAKYLVVATLAGSVVVGVVLNHAARHAVWRRRLAVAAGLVVVIHAVAALALVVGRDTIDALQTPSPNGGIGHALPAFSTLWLERVLSATALASLQFAVIFFVPQARRALLLALVAVEFFLFAPTHVVLAPAFSDEPSPIAALARRDAVFATPLCIDAHTHRMAMYSDGNTDPVENARRHMRFGLSEMQACHGLTSMVDYAPGAPRLAVSLVEALEETPALARALGCSTWLTPHPEDPSGMRAVAWSDEHGEPTSRIHGIRVLVVDDPLPDVAIARLPRLFKSEEAVQQALVTGTDSLSVVDDPLTRLPHDLVMPTAERVTALSLESEGPHVMTFRAEGTGGAIVVARTSYRVGFTAMQGEYTLPVVRVGGMFTGVLVDDVAAGDITLRYAPPHFVSGVSTALAGLVAFIALLTFARRRQGTLPRA